MRHRKPFPGLAALTLCWAAQTLTAAEPLPAEQFQPLHRLIKPQSGESKWLRVPWLLSVSEARQRAAAEGKPILIWSGGGCPPLGSC